MQDIQTIIVNPRLPLAWATDGARLVVRDKRHIPAALLRLSMVEPIQKPD